MIIAGGTKSIKPRPKRHQIKKLFFEEGKLILDKAKHKQNCNDKNISVSAGSCKVSKSFALQVEQLPCENQKRKKQLY